MIRDAETIATMAQLLVDARVDLNDWPAVLRSLHRPLCEATHTKPTAIELMALFGQAIDAARVLNTQGEFQ
jgi:hypothetical protein